MDARRLTPSPVQVDMTDPTDNGGHYRRRGVVRTGWWRRGRRAKLLLPATYPETHATRMISPSAGTTLGKHGLTLMRCGEAAPKHPGPALQPERPSDNLP
jgi:hypothetical protein